MDESSSNGNGRHHDRSDDPPEIFYEDPPGGRRPIRVDRASVKETFRDRRRSQEFYIRVHLSPKAATALVLLLTVLTRLVEVFVWWLLNGSHQP